MPELRTDLDHLEIRKSEARDTSELWLNQTEGLTGSRCWAVKTDVFNILDDGSWRQP